MYPGKIPASSSQNSTPTRAVFSTPIVAPFRRLHTITLIPVATSPSLPPIFFDPYNIRPKRKFPRDQFDDYDDDKIQYRATTDKRTILISGSTSCNVSTFVCVCVFFFCTCTYQGFRDGDIFLLLFLSLSPFPW